MIERAFEMIENGAKSRLLKNAIDLQEKLSKSMGVSHQMNCVHLYDVIETLQSLNELQAHRLESEIVKQEDRSKKSAMKFKWGWTPVSPMDYLGFLKKI